MLLSQSSLEDIKLGEFTRKIISPTERLLSFIFKSDILWRSLLISDIDKKSEYDPAEEAARMETTEETNEYRPLPFTLPSFS